MNTFIIIIKKNLFQVVILTSNVVNISTKVDFSKKYSNIKVIKLIKYYQWSDSKVQFSVKKKFLIDNMETMDIQNYS